MLQEEASIRIYTLNTSIQSGQSENTTGENEQQMGLKSPADGGMDPLLLGPQVHPLLLSALSLKVHHFDPAEY